MVAFQRMFDTLKIPHRKVKGWANVNCPYCKNPPDEHFNGGFSEFGHAYNCWRCGKHYWLEALSLILHMSPSQAKRVAEGYSTASAVEKKESTGKDLILPGFDDLNAFETEYLKQRGYNIPYLQKKYGIKGGGVLGEWSYRIIIPIFFEGRLISWTGRSILDRKTLDEEKIPRYKNLSVEKSAMNPKDILFNIDNCRGDSVVLVEGPFDVLRMGDGFVCSLGTSFTTRQIMLLKERFKEVMVAFDNEPSAQDKAKKLAVELDMVGVNSYVVNICADYNKNDPGELTANEAKEIRKVLEI